MENSKFGLSKKTNIAIAGVAGIGIVKDVIYAVIAIVVIVLVGITYQFVIDRNGQKTSTRDRRTAKQL